MPVEGVTLPDPVAVARDVLRGGLSAAVGTETPVDLLDRLPYVVAASFPGGGVGDPRFSRRTQLQVDAYADSRAAADALAADAQAVLLRAWLGAARFASGCLGHVRVTQQPAPLSTTGQPPGLHRSIALYVITVRP